MIVPRRLRWLLLTLLVVLLDRATKAWIESRPLTFFPHVVIPNYFTLIFSRNPGIAFSFFSNPNSTATRIVLIMGSLLIIGFIAWLLVTGRDASSFNAAGLSLLLGGAAGNLTDRIVHGAVTDFLEVWLHFLPWPLFNPWPTFNVADAAVTIGALLLIFDVLVHPRPTKALPQKTRI
jgi:signal peptidase II